jgi:S-adenosylmethionine:tRNA ribosyltransferase-isomerase
VRVSDFDFDLPQERIATRPATPRDAAKLMVLERRTGARRHLAIADLPALLTPGDLLVVNDTRVLPHRLLGRRATGGRVETLILERQGDLCRGYLRPAGKVRIGEAIAMEGGALMLHPLAALGGGVFRFRLDPGTRALDAVLESVGRAPLPPYLGRRGEEEAARDRSDYQTVFATRDGAIAAPTAGLHFTPELLAALREAGIALATVTLHVGEGTFAPVRVEHVAEHRMHAERFALPQATADAIAHARSQKKRVIAVGTTSARTLESRARDGGLVEPGEGETDLFLAPGARFRVVDALLTNFHLPRSTLLMLVAAFAGREPILDAYGEAIARGYRFYSFGDAMLIL